MKLDARRTAVVLRDPGEFRAILLYGEDAGLIRERGDQVTKSIIGSLDDPFRLAILEQAEHVRLSEEATALSLTGGTRVVRVRDAGDSLTIPITNLLDAKKSSLLVIEAPDLNSRSKLRALAEKRPDMGAIACYSEDGATLATTIREQLKLDNITVTPEALTWLTNVLGADRAATRSEINKLSLYVGQGNSVNLEDAEAAIGDTANLSVEDAIYAATTGDPVATDRAINLAIAEGAVGVQIIRASLMHLQKMLRTKISMQKGSSIEEAMRSLRPPIFFRRTSAFARAVNLFSVDNLITTANKLLELEIGCKTTGSRDETLGRYAMIVILRAARSRN
jgi:DNA polymerase-3 subunit delta